MDLILAHPFTFSFFLSLIYLWQSDICTNTNLSFIITSFYLQILIFCGKYQGITLFLYPDAVNAPFFLLNHKFKMLIVIN